MGVAGELDDVVVLDASRGLPGAYCAKLLNDAGAIVTHLEPPAGDPMRRWRWSGGPTEGDGALWRYLRHGQRSVVAAPPPADGSDRMAAHAGAADVIITDGTAADGYGPGGPPATVAARWPDAVVVSITPYGATGPAADQPATEFTVQADSGALAIRGIPELPPIQMGGRVVEWVAGAYAAVAALATLRRTRAGGGGDWIDVSLCEVANLTGANFSDLFNALAGRPAPTRPARSVEIPSIEPSADGWVGFNTNTREQWESFCLLIERPDLIEDGSFALLADRVARRDEWNALVRDWTTRHPTAEIVERAAVLRIPVAPVCDGRAVLELDHARVRGVFIDDPTGTLRMPRRPWTVAGEPAPAPGPAPTLGAHDDAPLPTRRPRPATGPAGLPLTGLQVVDLTAWWAGPSAAGLLATLGAEVIHVESPGRIDGMRTAGAAFYGRPEWWEYSPFFLAANTNKLDVTLDLDQPAGRALALELIAGADLVIENFTPRVVERFGLDWPAVHAANPGAVMVRMPAFGLDGPWRDRPGFAQTMEQITGLAWMTGHPGDQPRIQRGPCDPNGGLHAAFAALVGLARRDRTGVGCLVEAPMFEAALAVAAEVALEWSAYGQLMGRDGNRSPAAAPQNLYPCAGTDAWLALACATDGQWRALASAIGRPDLAADPSLATADGRRAAADRLDGVIGTWAADRELDEAVGTLLAAGVPAAPATDPRRASAQAQMAARGFFEPVDHPVVGAHPVPGLPWRARGVERWIRLPAPTLGQHNDLVLGGRLGHSAEELAALESAGVIGRRPIGA